MIKFTANTDFNFDVAVSTIVNSSSSLTKQAFAKDLLKFEKTAGQTDLHIIALGAYEGTGCFFEGAPVQTLSGIKSIEQVKVGDLVLTHKNRFKPVIHTFETGFSGIKVDLDVRGLPELVESTVNHPFLVIKGEQFTSRDRCPSLLEDGVDLKIKFDELIEQKATFIPAGQIAPGDYVVTPINPTLENTEVFTEDDAYLFGYYLSEGCLGKEYRDTRAHCGEYLDLLFTMSVNDQPCIDKLQEIIERLNGEKVTVQPSLTSDFGRRIQFQNYEKAQQCLRLFGCQSTSKYIAPVIFTQTREWKLKFLAAYLDGDGCIVSDDSGGLSRYIGTLTASTASRNLAYDLQRLLASCGIPSFIYRGLNKHSNGCFGTQDHVIYQVTVGATYASELTQHTLRICPVVKQRTYRTSRSWISNNYLIFKVNTVTQREVEDVVKYNLEVEEDNTYVVDIVGHNSNRNCDAFLEEDCRNNHHHFKDAGRAVHRHHKNKPADLKYGTIKASAYNEPMRRIELIVGLDNDKCADILEEQEKNGQTQWSMASKQAFDVCSWCHHRAKTDKDRCDCIPAKLGELRDDGVMCVMINPNPKWFEISHVKRGADRIGVSLKLADDRVKPLLPSDYLQLYTGFTPPEDEFYISKKAADKRVLLRKLAEMEKHIDAIAEGKGKNTAKDLFLKRQARLKKGKKIEDKDIDELRKHEPSKAMRGMADGGLMLGPEEFTKYLFGNRAKPEVASGMKTHLPHAFSKLEENGNADVVNSERFDPDALGMLPKELKSLVSRLFEGHSMFGEPSVRRVMRITIEMGPKGDEAELKPTEAPTKNKGDEKMAEVYATYKLAMLQHLQEQNKLTDDICWNCLIQNR